ncbi:hypothetical protein B0H12DRAFT_1238682 [Mycena haematopus]|nr:hypothetical protein B0H12DRAFT_1238682 [Mycena haematopus]
MPIQTSALNVQELCDLIAGFLTESKWDLRACALVSSTFTSAAQRHLFSEVILNRGSLHTDDLSFLNWYDEIGACGRLCVVLKSAPHLLTFIRRMRISLEPGVVKLLSDCEFHFPNLYDIVFHRRSGGPVSDETLVLASRLIGSPSIRRVGLFKLSLIFNDVKDLSRLFEKHTHALDSIFLNNLDIRNLAREKGNRAPSESPLVRVKTLRWGGHNQLPPAVILNPAFPFDLSRLADLDFGADLSLIARNIIESNRLSIRQLTLNAPNIVNENYRTQLERRPAFLAQFPVLTHLTLITTAHELADAEALLVTLPAVNNLCYLNLQIRQVRQLKEPQMRSLGAVCAHLHESCIVTVWVRRSTSGADGADTGSLVRAAFAELDRRGRLSIRV